MRWINSVSILTLVALVFSLHSAHSATFDLDRPVESAPYRMPVEGPGLDTAAQTLLGQAGVAVASSDFPRAEALALALTQSHPDAPQGWHMLGVALANQNKTDTALTALARAAELYTNNADPLVIRGDLMRAAGRMDEAKAEYQAALQRDPSEWRALEGLAVLAETQGDPAEAMTQYRAEIDAIGTERLFPHLRLAALYLGAGQGENAVDVLGAYVQAKPTDVGGLAALAQVHAQTGARAAALTDLDAAAKVATAHDDLLAIGQLQASMGAYDAAESLFARVAEADPKAALAQFRLASVRAARGKYDAALPAYDAALSVAQDDPQVLRGAAVAAMRAGDPARAIGYGDRLVTATPDAPESWLLNGWLHDEGKDREGAAAAYRKALAIDPKNIAALNNLAIVLVALGDTDEAQDLATRATQLAPAMPGVWNTFGLAQLAAGNAPQAVVAQEKAVELAPENANFRLDLGLARLVLGARDAGQADIAKAQELGLSPAREAEAEAALAN